VKLLKPSNLAMDGIQKEGGEKQSRKTGLKTKKVYAFLGKSGKPKEIALKKRIKGGKKKDSTLA